MPQVLVVLNVRDRVETSDSDSDETPNTTFVSFSLSSCTHQKLLGSVTQCLRLNLLGMMQGRSCRDAFANLDLAF